MFADNVDMPWMAKFVLGPGWNQASDDQKSRYQEAYKQYLLAQLAIPIPTVTTPHMFTHRLSQQARSDRKRIVLPEGDDDRILKAAGRVLKRCIADLTILGDRITTNATLREHHSHGQDAQPPVLPDAVAFVETSEEAARLLSLCHAERVPVVTANARSLPDLMNSIDAGRGSKETCTCPLSRSVSAHGPYRCRPSS